MLITLLIKQEQARRALHKTGTGVPKCRVLLLLSLAWRELRDAASSTLVTRRMATRGGSSRSRALGGAVAVAMAVAVAVAVMVMVMVVTVTTTRTWLTPGGERGEDTLVELTMPTRGGNAHRKQAVVHVVVTCGGGGGGGGGDANNEPGPREHRRTWGKAATAIKGMRVSWVGACAAYENENTTLPHVNVERPSPAAALAFAASPAHRASADFFFVMRHTSYLFPERLSALASALNANEPMWTGFVTKSNPHVVDARGGVLVSRALLDQATPLLANLSERETLSERADTDDDDDDMTLLTRDDETLARVLQLAPRSSVRFFPVTLQSLARRSLHPSTLSTNPITLRAFAVRTHAARVVDNFLPTFEFEALHYSLRVPTSECPAPNTSTSAAAALDHSAFAVLLPVSKSTPPAYIQAHRKTWMAQVPHVSVSFVGACTACDWDVPVEDAHRDALAPKVQAMFVEAAKRFPHSRYFLKIDLDTLVLGRNLVAVLGAALPSLSGNPSEQAAAAATAALAYLGIPITVSDYEHEFAQGGGGYVLSRAAVRALASCDALAPNADGAEDLFVGKCLAARAGVTKPARLAGFHPETLPTYAAFAQALAAPGSDSASLSHYAARTHAVSRCFATSHGYKSFDDYVAAFWALAVLSDAAGPGS